MKYIKKIHYIPWKYMFVLETDNNIDEQYEATKQAQKWAAENCTGQWLICSVAELSINAKPICDIPLTDEKYPVSRVTISSPVLIVFEKQDEATAFKLVFYGE